MPKAVTSKVPGRLPLVHVRGDLAHILMIEPEDKPPDSWLDQVAAYRDVKGFSYRRLRAGAWFVARAIRAALGEALMVGPCRALIADNRGDLTLSHDGDGAEAAILSLGIPGEIDLTIDLEISNFTLRIKGSTGTPSFSLSATTDSRSLAHLQKLIGGAKRPVDVEVMAGAVRSRRSQSRAMQPGAEDGGVPIQISDTAVIRPGAEFAVSRSGGNGPLAISDATISGLNLQWDAGRSPNGRLSLKDGGNQEVTLEIGGARLDADRFCIDFRRAVCPVATASYGLRESVGGGGAPQPLGTVTSYPEYAYRLLSAADTVLWDAKWMPADPSGEQRGGHAYRLGRPHGVMAGRSNLWIHESMELQAGAAGGDRDTSASEQHRHEHPNGQIEDIIHVCQAGQTPDILVLHDLNFGFRGDVGGSFVDWRNALQCAGLAPAEKANGPSPKASHVVAILGRSLPMADRAGVWRRDQMWAALLENCPDRTIVIVSAHTLRACGAKVSHRISWERTAQDCINALQCHPRAQHLLKFTHLIIRIGVVGCVYIYQDPQETRQYRLCYDPTAYNGFFRDPAKHGTVVGNNTIIAACVVRALAKSLNDRPDGGGSVARSIREALKEGIDACQRHYVIGYGNQRWCDTDRVPDATDRPGEARAPSSWLQYDALDRVFQQPADTLRLDDVAVPINTEWKILEEATRGNLERFAMDIVQRGIEAITSDRASAGFAPIARFGDDCVAVDREEIESYRTMYAMIDQYLARADERPMSLAVFGPPGSGKSFAVKRIARSIKREAIEELEFNLAQFNGPDDLAFALMKIRATDPKKIPLAFFDEFDCELAAKELGWLRYFLAPMEDGKFRYNEDMVHIKRAIFVFAGGTRQTFDEFSRVNAAAEERFKFAQAKGPDFTSRLTGHLDTVGINRRHASDNTYVVRRAVQLRLLLEERKLIGRRNLAVVDSQFLRAVLKVRDYKHGSRSMRHVFDMSVGADGSLRLPTMDQLNMHTDGAHFLELCSDFERARLATDADCSMTCRNCAATADGDGQAAMR